MNPPPSPPVFPIVIHSLFTIHYSTIPPRRYLEDHASPPIAGAPDSPYAGDLFAETGRYARLAPAVARQGDPSTSSTPTTG